MKIKNYLTKEKITNIAIYIFAVIVAIAVLGLIPLIFLYPLEYVFGITLTYWRVLVGFICFGLIKELFETKIKTKK